MSEPRTPMSTGSTSRRQVDDYSEVVTVTEPDGTVWQYYDIWTTGIPDVGRDFYVTRCAWALWSDGTYARRILEWQYDRPLQRPIIDEVASS
jgi:hypothetical protein